MSERVFKQVSWSQTSRKNALPTVEELLHHILAKFDDVPIRHLRTKDVDIIRHATLALEILGSEK